MKTYEIETAARSQQPTAVVRTTASVEQIAPWLGRAYTEVAAALAKQGTHPSGPPFARYHLHDDGRFDIEAGFPVVLSIAGDGDVQPSLLPGGSAASIMYVGPYDGMKPAYEAVVGWVNQHGQVPDGDPWETYLSDPALEPDPATWRTQIVQPFRPA